MTQCPRDPSPDRRIVVGVTGASGSIYAYRLVGELLRRGLQVHLVASSAGRQVIRREIPQHAGSAETLFTGLPPGDLQVHGEKNFFAPYCSGSFRFRAMVLVPATMGTVGALASGYVGNGLHRAADVALKEKIPLVVVPRETPLSTIHLRNLLTLAESGAIILPPVPAFYHAPHTIDDQIDFVISRILDHLGLENALSPRWRDGETAAGPPERPAESP